MRIALILPLLTALAMPAAAQLLPPVGQVLGDPLGSVEGTLGRATALDAAAPVRSVQRLAQDRVARLRDFVRSHRAQIEPDETDAPARRGIVLLLDPDPDALAAAQRLGFAARTTGDLDALGLAAAELSAPAGMSLTDALKSLRAALPGKTLSADPIHFPSGTARMRGGGAADGASMPALRTPVGMIDGGVGGGLSPRAAQGFATGAPVASDHGTAIASLLQGAGVRGIVAADVYGRDAAGGGALAIARALDWMVREKVPVVSISLVGPRNPLLERAVAAAQARGLLIVAAVGNDGPAAPPAYPASYPAVIAVTGVDGRDRALIEAGRALHLDYAAPGADMRAPDARGRAKALRGTSFAAPLVAARAAAALDRGRGGPGLRAALDAEAKDLGKPGADPQFGRGLLCADCVRR